MLKISNFFQKHLILPYFCFFLAGAFTLEKLHSYPQFQKFIEHQSIRQVEFDGLGSVALEAGALSDEATPPFWESPQEIKSSLDLNFEIVNIAPEKKPELTDESIDQILSDFQGRISQEFEIPSILFNQTKFWFRVYTEFDSDKKIIHDALHPHIIYAVVDVADIMSLPAKAAWLNTVKAQKLVSKRVVEIRNKLLKMVKKSEGEMDEEELSWLEQFKMLEGNQKSIIRTAAQNLRIQTGQKDFFEKGLSISGRYIDGMESIFKEKGLPVELTRLPFVESSFVIGATSKVGAAGIWQFMPGIGRRFMTVNDRVDERRNPWKATEAAAKLLRENFSILHKNWGLALTAYNHGPSGVRRAMQKIGTRDIGKIVKSYRSRSFDFASANFFTCFLAALHAQMYKDMLWADHVYEPALEFESIRLKKSFKPYQLEKATGLSDEQILIFNPELDRSFKKKYSIPKGFRMFLPADAGPIVKKAVAFLFKDSQN
jgi:membrane-bound lytic murein transglycosylase D